MFAEWSRIAMPAVVWTAVVLLVSPCLSAEPLAHQAAYWWQDELRTVAFALSESRTGKPAQWPQMTVPAGSAVLPLPGVEGPIQPDGKLDEPQWQQATCYPVGPIFESWRRGPFMLLVRACRSGETAYIGIQSPRDLSGLGAISPEAGLFTIAGKPYRAGPGGNLPDGCMARHGAGQTIELAVPLRGELAMTFTVETVRRVEGQLPVELKSLGLDRLATPGPSKDHRKPWLWLEPVSIRLVPADAAMQAELPGPASPNRFAARILAGNQEPRASEQSVEVWQESGVYAYQWQAEVAGQPFRAEGFWYIEPVAESIRMIERIVERVRTSGSRCADTAGTLASVARLKLLLEKTSATDAQAWRDLYCQVRQARGLEHLRLLDAPLLFVKQHPYFAGHIYDDYYTWHPGGGIYLLRNPHDPHGSEGTRVVPVVDPAANETLGEGVYRDPDLSWEADRVLFAFKPAADAVTSLYEIGIDGRGLRRLTSSDKHHDITPAWLPDGRIVFTSTRPRALVPCFNSGVDTLHTMNADGSDIRSISANNVNEFDPVPMPDGRILYGRWEYVDKTALYMQSLWTVLPDGRMEEALFANNLAKPTAVLDARPVPGAREVVASLTPHNGQAVGAIAAIDLDRGKNDLAAVRNFTPEYPVEMDQGLRTGPCDPWPLSADDVLMSNNAIGSHGILELVDREGHRELVHCDPEISCFAPMLVKPRQRPPVVSPQTQPGEPGRFLLVDVYRGLDGVPRGAIKKLRIIEETARTSGLPPGGRWWNQAFLVSWQGAYIIKNYLGTVPVHEDGSAYFEVPPGRALYFTALDEEGREIQRMRTFVQAAPGATRSCTGCHENKKSTPVQSGHVPLAMLAPPAEPQPESWGSGYIDYPTMVQPILDKHCVRCHGGQEGMAKGIDLSGGWTWAFNISYETLIKHRLTGFLNCHNSSVHTAAILPPRTIGSGAAPLAEILIQKHPELSRSERDLILAWMDTNSNYYGTWDYTPYATCDALLAARGELASAMQQAGCNRCHQPGHIGNDWVNLQTPEWSRILRAPMAKSAGGLGLEMCRKRKTTTGYPLVNQSVQPPDIVLPTRQPEWDPSGDVHVSFSSTTDPNYQHMLELIRHTQAEALARPRVDMPGAEIVPGECRLQVPMPVPQSPPAIDAKVREDYAVELAWQRTAATIGLQYELHRGLSAGFAPGASTQIGLTTAGKFIDPAPPAGKQYYALVVTSGTQRSQPVWATVDVPEPIPPEKPSGLSAEPLPGKVTLRWSGPVAPGVRYQVCRSEAGIAESSLLTPEPIAGLSFTDLTGEPAKAYRYAVRAINRRGQAGEESDAVEASPLPEIREPVLAIDFAKGGRAERLSGPAIELRLHRGAKIAGGVLDLGTSGFATLEHVPELDLDKAFSMECWAWIDREAQMPVVVSCGAFNSTGWFLQRYGRGWRWHLAPVSCDGGQPAVGRWTHLVGTYDGRKAHLYQDGKPIASVDCFPNRAAWSGPLVLGQYGSQSANYQVEGKIREVRIYHRALEPKEVAERFRKGQK